MDSSSRRLKTRYSQKRQNRQLLHSVGHVRIRTRARRETKPPIIGLLATVSNGGQVLQSNKWCSKRSPWPAPETCIFGAVYHLTLRGNARQRILFTHRDREQFCRTLSGILARGGAKAIEEAYTKHGYTMKEIGKRLDVHYATVSRQLKKLEKPRAV